MTYRTVVAFLVVAVAVLSAGCPGENFDDSAGFVVAHQINEASENASVVPVWNDTVRSAEPVVRAVTNASLTDDGAAEAFFGDGEGDSESMSEFTSAIPDGPVYDDGTAYGWYYVRVNDRIVVLEVARCSG